MKQREWSVCRELDYARCAWNLEIRDNMRLCGNQVGVALVLSRPVQGDQAFPDVGQSGLAGMGCGMPQWHLSPASAAARLNFASRWPRFGPNGQLCASLQIIPSCPCPSFRKGT